MYLPIGIYLFSAKTNQRHQKESFLLVRDSQASCRSRRSDNRNLFIQGYNYITLTIPNTSTEGEVLLVDKLFYTIWIVKDGQEKPYIFTADLYSEDFNEDVTEIPYAHDGYDVYGKGEKIYFEDTPGELATWSKVGVQTIYYGGGERRTSEIAWAEMATDIQTVNADKNGKAVIYNLNGQRVETVKKGLYIVNGHKVVVK